MRAGRGVPHRAAGWLRSALPPRSRVDLVLSGTFLPPARSEFAHYGEGSWIVAPSQVSGARHVWVDEGVLVMEHSEIRAHPPEGRPPSDPLVRLGDGTRLARFMTIWATLGVHFGARVSTSDNVAVMDCWYPPGEHSDLPAPDGARVTIDDGAYLGYGCVIGPGVTVGSGAFVGEGAVVLEDVPPHCVVYGNPARVTKRWNERDGWQGDMFGANR